MSPADIRRRLGAAHGEDWRDVALLALLALEHDRAELLRAANYGPDARASLDLNKVAPSVLVRWPCPKHDPPKFVNEKPTSRCAVCQRAGLERFRLLSPGGDQ